ncbi:hypothetical protein [Bacillus toyonensis]|uniref:hypothetical protein n=1 Tax=Bacillus toyonensis TaxID=155322 RepID=UPI000BFB8E06|nr:hypothetical protein [Bacillus toyonensis]PHG57700.1 hypothetical protein COI59_29470 [Bacillus toyonensis]
MSPMNISTVNAISALIPPYLYPSLLCLFHNKNSRKMRIIESILQNKSRFLISEEKFEVHQLLLEVSVL